MMAAVLITLTLVSWGYTGHYKISYNSSLSFYTQMSQFYNWTQYIADHASDADDRKENDPTEAPKHYIDIDNYFEFTTTQTIPQTWDSVIAARGIYFVMNQGILPWATLATYDSLKKAMQRNDWEEAVFYAADLGHYVADGHMPLHITKNYNGQYSGNDGIHSRYESTMINYNNSQIVYTGDTVKIIANINQYVFDYLYENYKLVDSIIIADDYATSLSSNYYSSTYKAALWNKTKNFTIRLFKNASHAIAELIYNAWLEAGCPAVGVAGILANSKPDNNMLLNNYPNPFNTYTDISFFVPSNSEHIFLEVYNSIGHKISTISQGVLTEGNHMMRWEPAGVKQGVFFLVLRSRNFFVSKKVALIF